MSDDIQRQARIVDDVAIEILDGDPSERFHPDLAALFEPVPADVVVGSVRVDDAWVIPEDVEPETPDEPERVPVQLAIIDLLRLFTVPELAGFNALRKACVALEPADYVAAAEGDPGKAALVGFEVFLTFYDALRAGLIELNHSETIQGLSLLVPLGVLTPERLAEVLAGNPPA